MTIDELIDAARNGSIRAAGRLLSLVESPRRGEVLDALGAAPAPRVVGVTGPPGAGKSTTVGRWWARPRTGHASCGACRRPVIALQRGCAARRSDPNGRTHQRLRCADQLRGDAWSPGRAGRCGARRHPAAAALSYDLIVLETVGVGQSEIEIAAIADPTIVLLNPGVGDAVRRPRRVCSKSPTSWW